MMRITHAHQRAVLFQLTIPVRTPQKKKKNRHNVTHFILVQSLKSDLFCKPEILSLWVRVFYEDVIYNVAERMSMIFSHDHLGLQCPSFACHKNSSNIPKNGLQKGGAEGCPSFNNLMLARVVSLLWTIVD